MMLRNEMLNVLAKAEFDNSITSYETHTHQPYIATALDVNDELRIPIQNHDLLINVHDSFILLEGKITKATGADNRPVDIQFVANPFAHLFEEISYLLNGQVIDKTRQLGILSTIKGYATFNESEAKTNWNLGGDHMAFDGTFSACLPLKCLLGFAEHYKRILLNARHELVLLRAKSNDAAFVSTLAPKLELFKVEWHVPYVKTSIKDKREILEIIDNPKSVIQIPFRSYEIFECSMLTGATRQSWSLKTSTEMEKPRAVIVAFQTDRKKITKDSSKFDHCDILNIKLFLNGENFPYDSIKCHFTKNQYEILYRMYANFQKSYLNRDSEPLFDRKQFKKDAPLTVIDCSKQVESISNVMVDVRLEIEANATFPQNTICYAVIIHDRLVEYSPNQKIVKILV